MATTQVREPGAQTKTKELIISADSHVMEPHDLWTSNIANKYSEPVPEFPPPVVGEGFQAHPGGHDPHARVKEMAEDGVSAEVLYPTLGLAFAYARDPDWAADLARAYNDYVYDHFLRRNTRLKAVALLPVQSA